MTGWPFLSFVYIGDTDEPYRIRTFNMVGYLLTDIGSEKLDFFFWGGDLESQVLPMVQVDDPNPYPY